MIIVNEEVLNDFTKRYRNAGDLFEHWKERVESASWSSPEDARQKMPGIRSLGHGRLVFNVGGHDYRIVADVNYVAQQLRIHFVGTHAQYDRILKTGGFTQWRRR